MTAIYSKEQIDGLAGEIRIELDNSHTNTVNHVQGLIDNLQQSGGGAGETGAVGPKGDKGDKGDTGEQGIQGIAGQDGAKGAKGDKGAQGEQGIAGTNGADGAQGIQGPEGPAGSGGGSGGAGGMFLDDGREIRTKVFTGSDMLDYSDFYMINHGLDRSKILYYTCLLSGLNTISSYPPHCEEYSGSVYYDTRLTPDSLVMLKRSGSAILPNGVVTFTYLA